MILPYFDVTFHTLPTQKDNVYNATIDTMPSPKHQLENRMLYSHEYTDQTLVEIIRRIENEQNYP